MTGPFDRLFGNGPFDLNHDGKIDPAETAFINDTFYEENHLTSARSYEYEEEGDPFDEIELAGLDRDDLEFMDEDERREALEDAGLDPDDFDDEF
jgi:hypothetical protein